MSRSLNKDHKNKIIRAFLVKAFTPAVEALTDKNKALADEVWDHVLGQYREVIPTLPEGLIKTGYRFYVNTVTGFQSAIRADGNIDSNYYSSRFGNTVFAGICNTASKKHDSFRPWAADDGQEIPKKLFTRLEAMRDAAKKLYEEFQKTQAELTANLKPLKTVEKLLKQWPEAEEFIPVEALEPPAPVPAKLDALSLNKTLNKYQKAS